jgi:hypothetical protein
MEMRLFMGQSTDEDHDAYVVHERRRDYHSEFPQINFNRYIHSQSCRAVTQSEVNSQYVVIQGAAIKLSSGNT